MTLSGTVTTKFWAHRWPSDVSHCTQGTVLWESPYLIHVFACHCYGIMLGSLSVSQFLFFAFQARYHGNLCTWVIALPITVTTKCWAYCLPLVFFLCVPGTIRWESPYLSHGFACHLHNEILGPLSAFHCLCLHSRHGTMGVTVPESCLCLPPSQRNAGPIVCLSIFSLCIPGMLPWESPYLGHRFACHRHDKMPGWLLALAAGPIRPTLDTSAGLLACLHHARSAQCCILRPSTGA